MMWGWNDYWPWMHFGPVMFIVFMVLCMGIMFFMMRGHRGRSGGQYALDILKERFARGEISQAQYEEQRRLLEV